MATAFSEGRPSILISGASIAGPTLAYWLSRAGWRTTIVERAPRLRGEGQNIDVRGAGREVARRMGIEAEIRAATTGELGTAFIGGDGRVIARFPAGRNDTDGPTAELEILRGELSRIVYERTREDTEYIFGDHITGIEDSADAVSVSFAAGPNQSFDLVVLAEGMRSHTRSLVFEDEPRIRSLGMYTSYLAIPRTDADEDWWRWLNAPGGRSVTLRPDNVGTTRATLSFLSEPKAYENQTPDEQRRILRRIFGDIGWQTPRILDALDGAELYVEAIGQVHAPHWSRGRVGLVGDAAYCASPISGMGTSLALVGGYVLAGELATRSDHRAAFARFQHLMRPYVAKAQKLPPGAPRIANPKSRLGVAAFHAGLRIASSRAARKVGGLTGGLFSPPADEIDLPTYNWK